MGFGNIAIDEANYEMGRGNGIATVLTILKDYTIEELLTCEDDRLRLVAEFLVERRKDDCNADRLKQLITEFEEVWKKVFEDPFSPLNHSVRRGAFSSRNRPVPSL